MQGFKSLLPRIEEVPAVEEIEMSPATTLSATAPTFVPHHAQPCGTATPAASAAFAVPAASAAAAAAPAPATTNRRMPQWTHEQRIFVSALASRSRIREPRAIAEEMVRVFPGTLPRCPAAASQEDENAFRELWLSRLEGAVRGHLAIWASRHAEKDLGASDCTGYGWIHLLDRWSVMTQ